MNLGRYLEVLRAPGVARVAVFATMGRLPFAIVPLSILLLMREEGYQYAQIGAVAGAARARGDAPKRIRLRRHPARAGFVVGPLVAARRSA